MNSKFFLDEKNPQVPKRNVRQKVGEDIKDSSPDYRKSGLISYINDDDNNLSNTIPTINNNTSRNQIISDDSTEAIAKPFFKNNLSMETSNLKLKNDHKCLETLDVTVVINNKPQSSRKIGLVQGSNGSYGFFVWIDKKTTQQNELEELLNGNDNFSLSLGEFDIETIVPIDPKFNYKLVSLDPFIFEFSAPGSDLSLVIQYGETLIEDENQPPIVPKSRTTSESSLDKLLQELDPLSGHQTNNQRETKSRVEHNQKPNSNQLYQFVLFYNEMTEKFVSTLQHIVSVSHRTFTVGIDFEWIFQYSPLLPMNISNTQMKNEKLVDLFDDLTADYQKTETAPSTSMSKDNFSSKSKHDSKKEKEKKTRKSSPNPFLEDRFEPDLRTTYLNPESPDHFGDDDSSLNYLSDNNRELQIQIATEERKNEYSRYEKYTLFIGTWNVNGQVMTQPEVMRTKFLAVDPNAPDFYAVGFQELDLSKEAFLFNDNRKEDYWIQLCEKSLHPDRKYILLKKVRLIGMMLVIFVAEEFNHNIRNVSADVVGTGILGKMGNKGAVAIRFDLFDTSICFVNCHLAAHVDQYERRNLDYREINSRLQFSQVKPPKPISSHDQIYWFGDLNYRIMTLNSEMVKALLDAKEYDSVLAHDQLKLQMQAKNCFQGYTEGTIRHMPSYKYNPGTNQWDSSEKRRPPAWCDRILWKGENIKQVLYRSHPDLKDSDHKPVSAVFHSHVLVIDHVLKRKVYEDVMKKLDKVENEMLPQVSIDTTEINFGSVAFKDNTCRVLNLTNIGQTKIKYRFINKPNDMKFCKDWLRVTPSAGTIPLKEQITIAFELNFDDPLIAYKFNYGIETISDTLVLSLIGGKDIFITIYGDYKLSCFGCTLDTLVQLEKPISSFTLKEFQQNFPPPTIRRAPNYKEKMIDIVSGLQSIEVEKEATSNKLPLPKELYALVDHLFRNGYTDNNIFQSSGMENEFFIIRDALDSMCINQIKNVSEHSIAEALLLFLETLPEPVIPYNYFDKVYRANKNRGECKQIFNELPVIHRMVFQYLMKFLQEICNCSDSDKTLNKLLISKIFAPILVRKPPDFQDSMLTMFPITSTSSSSTFLSTASPSAAIVDTLTAEQFFIYFFLDLKEW